MSGISVLCDLVAFSSQGQPLQPIADNFITPDGMGVLISSFCDKGTVNITLVYKTCFFKGINKITCAVSASFQSRKIIFC